MPRQLEIVILGLSITSSWGNGHATCYRGLVKALTDRGHRTLFLERDAPWYAANRDLPRPPHGETSLYGGLDELRDLHAAAVRRADLVLVGSYVIDGPAVNEWVFDTARGVVAFYDIDTPVTLAALDRGECEYLHPQQVSQFDLYLSFAGGPNLVRLEEEFGAPLARPFYCSVDPERYFPDDPLREPRWELGYLGTYSPDRQPPLDELLTTPAREWPEGRFAVVGPQYPTELRWPKNVERIEHLPPAEHRGFYNGQRFTLNITRAAMIATGYSPSVRLFEAAACEVPIISDRWAGMEEVLEPGREILLAGTAAESLRHLRETSEAERRALAERARGRILARHTCEHRAMELEQHLQEVRRRGRRPANRRGVVSER